MRLIITQKVSYYAFEENFFGTLQMANLTGKRLQTHIINSGEIHLVYKLWVSYPYDTLFQLIGQTCSMIYQC